MGPRTSHHVLEEDPVPAATVEVGDHPHLAICHGTSDVSHARCFGDAPRLHALVRIPSAPSTSPRPLVVAVHGIRRRHARHAALMAEEADRRGFVLVAPQFDAETYPDYQRLGRRGLGERADLVLKHLIAQLRSEGVVNEELYLAGYSGGAQFVHRFTLAWPRLVTATVSASAGWYTLPDARSAYPHGIRSSARLPGIRFDPEAFLQVPMLAAVGSDDVLLERSLRQSPRVARTQGRNRVVRAENWVKAMKEAARVRGLEPRARLEILNAAGHSFEDCVAAGLDRLAFDFFSQVRAMNGLGGFQARRGA